MLENKFCLLLLSPCFLAAVARFHTKPEVACKRDIACCRNVRALGRVSLIDWIENLRARSFQSKGAIHSTKISGNFGLKLNGSVRSNRKSFEKSVDLFSRLDRPDRNGPFHLTIPIHFQSQDLAVRYLPCTKWRKILITVPLWIGNSRSIGVTRTSISSKLRHGPPVITQKSKGVV